MKALKIIILTIVLFVTALFLPFFPTVLIDNNDPVSINDSRVFANISDNDLKKILYLVRGEKLLSIYEYLSLYAQHNILRIHDSEVSIRRKYPNKNSTSITIPAIGKVTISIGYNCGRLCGNTRIFYLDKIDGKWVILKTSHLIS